MRMFSSCGSGDDVSVAGIVDTKAVGSLVSGFKHDIELYALEDEEDLIDIDPEEFIQYFSITSDYEIHLLDYSKTARKTCTEEVYYLDSSRHFVLQESESTN